MTPKSPLNIALLGPSGAGKGTHAAGLCSRFALRHVATGDLFREHVLGRTALGILAKKYMDQAELVPNEVVDAMIEEWCGRLPPTMGTLFDGFPRTSTQMRFLETQLAALNRSLDAVIFIRVGDDEIVRRLAGRFICRSCHEPYHLQQRPPQVYGVCDECGGQLYHRPDDAADMVRNRLRVFHRNTDPVIEHYAAAGKLIIVSGEGPIADIDARLVRAFEALQNGTATFATQTDLMKVTRPVVAPARSAESPLRSDIVLIGGPGSGKGTQSLRLAAQLKVPHIATGDLFRENLRIGTPLGELARAYMDRGELVPDHVTEAMVEERLSRPDVRSGFVLDGFPRTLPQAQALTEMLGRMHRRLAGVLHLKVSDDVLVMRLSGRLICRQCQAPYHTFFNPPRRERVCDACGGELYQRSDDNADTVRARLVTYHHQTEPLIAYYRDAGLLHDIDGEEDVDDITRRLLARIREFVPTADVPDFAPGTARHV